MTEECITPLRRRMIEERPPFRVEDPARLHPHGMNRQDPRSIAGHGDQRGSPSSSCTTENCAGALIINSTVSACGYPDAAGPDARLGI